MLLHPSKIKAWIKRDAYLRPLVPAQDEDPGETRSWTQRFFNECNTHLWHHEYFCATKYPEWFAESGLIDQETIEHRDYYIPLGWSGVNLEHGEEMGQSMLVNIMELLEALAPSLQAAGASAKEVAKWIANVKAEIGREEFKSYFPWRAVWGYRNSITPLAQPIQQSAYVESQSDAQVSQEQHPQSS